LGHLFHEAARREDIERAPCIPAQELPERHIDWYSPQEQILVLAQVPEAHRPIFRFLFIYGCRVAEACALCWDAVDRGKGIVSFRRTFSRGMGLVPTTKSRRDRELPLFDDFEAYLDSIPPGIGQTPVYRNPDARTHELWYSPWVLRKIWIQACTAAGLEPIPLKNGTRHSAGMQLLNLQGADFEDVRLLLGHSDSTMTRRYAQPGLARLKGLRDGKIRRLTTDVVNPLSTAQATPTQI
ncbi:MAG: tyrosine-type recombinase/integrase, partial [Pseudomonadota bacterium]